MKTAMQELFSQLEIEHPNLFNTNTLEGIKFINDYYKFLELEKQQIKNANSVGVNQSLYGYKNAEQYYNETFEKQITMQDLLDYNRFRIEAMQIEICDLKALCNTLETYCFELADDKCPREYKTVIKRELYNLKNK